MESNIVSKFESLGAKVSLRTPSPTSWRSGLRLDVRNDRKKGEVFQLDVPEDVTLEVIDIDKKRRHLLLMARQPINPRVPDEKTKFLCGHDERHWFVAGVPSQATSITQAMELLKPRAVREQQARKGIKTKDRNRRRNDAFVRQGEWFFTPEPNLHVDPKRIIENEPISRGFGKPHICRYVYRSGGESVWVCSQHPTGVLEKVYKEILAANPKAKDWNWRLMRRNAAVYAKGWVTHPDHATVTLNGWHRVSMSNERREGVAFLD